MKITSFGLISAITTLLEFSVIAQALPVESLKQDTAPPQHTSPFQEDDSARCRLSGICEGTPSQLDCARNENILGLDLFSTTIDNPFDFIAAHRDAHLACTFDTHQRAERIKDAARWTWKGYMDCASGFDELHPLTCQGGKWHLLTLTPVDALDTLYLMNLTSEFNEAMSIITDKLIPGNADECNVFETTIRILGGLLSAHRLTNSSHLLDTAVDLGSRLIHAFNSSTGIPFSDINLASGSTSRSVQSSSLAEATTLSLEFTLLSRLTGEPSFENKTRFVHDALTQFVDEYDGLLPKYVSPNTGGTSGDVIMLGARSDSYYEYLLKQWIMTGREDDLMRDRYVRAMRSVRSRLLRQTPAGHLLFVGEENRNTHIVSSKMDHLVCFLPGTLALGDFYGVSTKRENATDELTDLELAERLAETCYQLYKHTPTGLAPEIVYFQEQESDDLSTSSYPGAHASDVGGGDFIIKDADSHNLLRPETVESLFILWKVTGNPKYRDQAWLIFRAFERWTRVEGLQMCLYTDPAAALAHASHRVATIAARNAADMLTSSMPPQTSPEDALKHSMTMVEMHINGLYIPSSTPSSSSLQLLSSFKDIVLSTARSAATATINALSSVHNIKYIGDGRIDRNTATATETMNKTNKSSTAELQDGDHTLEEMLSKLTCGGDQSRTFANLRGGGYSNLESVTAVPPRRKDKMESFWIAETLKYLYLIFSEPPDRCTHPSCTDAATTQQQARLPLTEIVFNTEAHPLPIVGPKERSFVGVVDEFNRDLLDPFTHKPRPPLTDPPTEEELRREEQEEWKRLFEGREDNEDYTKQARGEQMQEQGQQTTPEVENFVTKDNLLTVEIPPDDDKFHEEL